MILVGKSSSCLPSGSGLPPPKAMVCNTRLGGEKDSAVQQASENQHMTRDRSEHETCKICVRCGRLC